MDAPLAMLVLLILGVQADKVFLGMAGDLRKCDCAHACVCALMFDTYHW